MINGECLFDPLKDCTAVEQYGFIDLVESYKNGVVPSQLEGSEEDYNGIEAPEAILGKPQDIFDAYKMKEYVDKYSKDEGHEVKDSANG